MNNAELIATLYYSGIALLFALTLVLVQGLFLSIESRFAAWTMPAIPLLMCVGLAISTALSGRNLKFAAQDIRTIGSLDGGGGGSLMRAISAVVIALCFAKIVHHLMKFRQRHDMPGGRALLISFLAFAVSTHVLSAAFGKMPAFIHNSYYPLLVFVAIFMTRTDGLQRCIDGLKLGLVILMVGSLVAAVVAPGLAIQPDYAGWLPGFKVRLWGLGSNANSIGPLALLLLLLDHMQPYRNRGWRLVVWGVTLLVLVLAQSKTVWLISVVLAAFMFLYGTSRDGRREARMSFVVLLCAALAIGTLGIYAADTGKIANKLMGTQIGTDLSTLTGRATIWATALRTWEDSFWFGYGPDAWGPLFRAQVGLPFAFHAHNQFLQSLSSAGLFGGLALLIYVVLMGWASIHAAKATRGASLALAMFMLGRCFTEVPLEVDGLFIGETILHLAWFMVVLTPYAARQADEAPAVNREYLVGASA